MIRSISFIILVTILNSTVYCASITVKWTGTTNNDWSTASNWDAARVPGYSTAGGNNGDYVWINYFDVRPEGCTISSGSQTIYSLYIMREGVDDNTKQAVLNLQGGSLTISGYEFKMGQGVSSYYSAHPHQPVAVFNMYDGSTLNINASGGITIGDYYNAVFNVYGGTYNHNAGGFRISNSSYNGGLGYGAGTLNLYGGRINLNVFSTSTNQADLRDLTLSSRINVGDGTMALVGDCTARLQAYASQGLITAISGRILSINYDPADGVHGTTYLRAVYPVKAYNPAPYNHAIDVNPIGTVMSWLPAAGTTSHKVYFGTSPAELSLIAQQSEPQRTVAPGVLDYDKKYYWRVDEVDSDGDVASGDIWEFSVSDGLIIDGFEDYNDANPISARWAIAGNGSVSLETQAGFDSIQTGYKSLKLDYNNNNSYSEAVFTYAAASNWTQYNIRSLAVRAHGSVTNLPDKLYVVLEDSTGAISNSIFYSVDPNSIVQTKFMPWLQFNIDLGGITGINKTIVKKLHIGIGNRTSPSGQSSGTVHIDNIMLNPARCLSGLYPRTDFNGDCFINLSDMAAFAATWLHDGSPESPHALPVLRYDFENQSDPTTVFDVQGSNNGAIVDVGGTNYNGNYDTVDGRKCYRFWGAYGDVGISIPASAFIAMANRFSVSFWAYGDETLPATVYAFKFVTTNGNSFFTTLPSSGGYFYYLTGMTDSVTYHPVNPLYKGQWNHWAFTRDFADGNVSMYLNGNLVAYRSDASVISDPGLNNIRYAWLGSRELTSDVTKPDTSYQGWIDDFRLYNYVLSQEEIINLAGQSFRATLKSDFNNDGVINIKDMSYMVENWLKTMLWPNI